MLRKDEAAPPTSTQRSRSVYSTCLFCHTSLGRNESVEQFPVGRRLAFDAAKGRLWVVCQKCGKWNLTPLEERWEAIEECERLFRDTRARVCTDQIGLARAAGQLDLLRIGRPPRAEFAAWRYGDQLGERRKRLIARGASGALVIGAVALGVPALIGTTVGAFVGVQIGLEAVWPMIFRKRPLYLPHPEGGSMEVALDDRARLVVLERGGWGLRVAYAKRVPTSDALVRRDMTSDVGGVITVEGAAALHALGLLLARINVAGAGAARVRDAVNQIESLGGPERYVPEVTARARAWAEFQHSEDAAGLGMLPPYTRLALEIAAHEESERAAMEGELAALEAAWKQAEEIAAIADELLLPRRVTDALDRMRATGRER